MNSNNRQLVRLTEAMLPAIAAVWRESSLLDPCSPDVLAEKLFADEAVTPTSRVGLFEQDQLVGFAAGAVRGEQGFLKLIAVLPTHRRQQVGTILANQIDLACVADGARRMRIGESAPNYLTPGIDADNKDAINFFKRIGYDSIGEAFNQSVDLTSSDWDSTEDQARLAAEHQIEIVRATREDQAAIDTFLDVDWPTWKGEVHSALANRPASVHIATHAGNVIAFAAHDANNKGTGWFGPMGTAPASSGKGLGRVLLHCCLADMKTQGHQTATIPWVGPLGFYEKHAGAKLSRTFVRMEKETNFNENPQ